MFSFLKGMKRARGRSPSKPPPAASVSPHINREGSGHHNHSSSNRHASSSSSSNRSTNNSRSTSRPLTPAGQDIGAQRTSTKEALRRSSSSSQQRRPAKEVPPSAAATHRDGGKDHDHDGQRSNSERHPGGKRLSKAKGTEATDAEANGMEREAPLETVAEPRPQRRAAQGRTRASTRSVEKALARYPPAGTPAAAAAAAAEEERQERHASTIPRQTQTSASVGPSWNSDAVAADAVPSPPLRPPPPSPRRTSAGLHAGAEKNAGRNNQRHPPHQTPPATVGVAPIAPTSQRPLQLSNDAVFMQYLRQARSSSGDHRRSPAHGDRTSAAGVARPKDDVEKKKKRNKSTDVAPAQRGPSPHVGRTSSSHLRTLPPKAGAVTFSGSSSSDDSGGNDYRDKVRTKRGSPPREMSSPPLVDARKAFKISPVRARREGQQQQQALPSSTERRASPSHTEAEGLTEGREMKSHNEAPQHAEEARRKASREESSRSTRREESGDDTKDGAPHARTSTSRRDAPSLRRQRAKQLSGNPSDHSNDDDDDSNLLTQTPPATAEEAAINVDASHPLDAERSAWVFTDMSTNITSHRLHHHRHEHLPHHKSLPGPPSLGTRRLHAAWASYLHQHGQPRLYRHHDDGDSGGSGVITDGPAPSPGGRPTEGSSPRTASAALHRDAQEEQAALVEWPGVRGGNNDDINDSSGRHPNASATTALRDRLRECAKEVLLLRASLLMTYTLLAAGGEERTMRSLTTSVAARQWAREVDRAAGWTAATEQREKRQEQQQQRDAEGKGGGDGVNSPPSPSVVAVAAAQRRRRRPSSNNGRDAPALSFTRTTTPWPALEARLAASVHAAAQNLADVSASLPHGSPQRQGTQGMKEGSGHGAALGLSPPPPRLLLRETPSHDLKGLPSLWYPSHLSDAVGPVSGVLSVWFSGDDDEDKGGDASEDEEEAKLDGNAGHVSDTNTQVTDAAHLPPQRNRSSRLSVFSRGGSAGGSRSSSKKNASSSAVLSGGWRRCFVVADDHGVRVYPTERDYADYASERLLMAVSYTSLAYLISDFAAAAAAPVVVEGGRGADGDQHETATSPSSLSAVHVCTIAAVGAHLCSHDDEDAAFIHFGFVHRQTTAAEQRVAAAASTCGVSLHHLLRSRSGPHLRFAPWRVHRSSKRNGSNGTDSRKGIFYASSSSSSQSTRRLHPPLVFRTQSLLAHAEWVHYFAYKFNRHLYRLMFPTTCAAMAEVGLQNKETQTDIFAEDRLRLLHDSEGVASFSLHAEPEQQQQHRHRHSRNHHRSQRDDSAIREDDYEAPYERSGANNARHFNTKKPSRRSSAKRRRRRGQRDGSSRENDSGGDDTKGETSSSLSSPSRLSAPPSPPKGSVPFNRALQHAGVSSSPSSPLLPPALDSSTSAGDKHEKSQGNASLVQAVTELRRTLEHRDQQLRDYEDEQAALVKVLRQRERQVQALQHDQQQLRAELQESVDRQHQQRQNAIVESQREEVERLRAVADAAAVMNAPPHKSPATDRHRNDKTAQTVSGVEAAHAQESALLRDQLNDLQRRYAADHAAWRAAQQALEARCRTTEMQVRNLREGASHQLRALAHQAVRDLDDFHEEVAQGTERCVTAMLRHNSTPRRLQAPPNLHDDDGGSSTINTPRRSSPARAAPMPVTAASTGVTAVTAAARAIASLLLTFQSGNGCLVDGELTVDPSEARLLFSGPTANQRGRRWELRHHDTDALLRIQLELLSRKAGDPRTSPRSLTPAILNGPPSWRSRSHSRTGTPIAGRSPHSRPAAPPRPPPPPPALSASERASNVSADDSRASADHRAARRSVSAEGAAQTPLSAVLRAVNVSPRATRASRLRRAATERQIQEREALEDA
ncbi:hypothetical protein ABB37_08830 [Leptomonas pyrrhocoris]|uniref:Uncharacterized protein n=1 Tax=Leptomonas pyrrhocoris TaxID=157538 RepID=A0A0N0DRU4_LEPPY|nr:hypothetical protein ABB37_08830 [Leptomonas pyrrhocoris]KPA75168.1 hypothetical protein ABB37_08830 [Leptomonas pyrrhocoris]|eukprot:XP_015653607.1 hypothetical protein ABB37_08830 [Leptomonas pyrrhocoris]